MSKSTTALTPLERRAAVTLSAVVALRLFGLFAILPVFAAFARDLGGVTPFLIGIALGVYGLTQGSLQIPLGWLSDRIGRKRVIGAGLTVFVAGSVVAACSDHIWGVIAGRALQGGGAIAGAAMALVADISRESQRSKAMAMIGASVGAAFALAMIAGPLLAGGFGLAGLFWITAALGVGALVMLMWLVPEGGGAVRPAPSAGVPVATGPVADWCLSILLLHGILTALFVVLPVALAETTGLAPARHWLLYLPALAVAGVVSLIVVFAGRESHAPFRLAPGVALVALSCAVFAFGAGGPASAFLILAAFFTGFSLLEATLPALMSYTIPAHRRGTAMGVFATCEFLGAFLGGASGGFVLGAFGRRGVFFGATAIAAAWFLYAALRTHRWARVRTA